MCKSAHSVLQGSHWLFCSAEVVLTTCISSSVKQHKMFEMVYMLDVHVGPIDLNLFINFLVDQNSSKAIGTKWNDTALVMIRDK